MKKCKNCGTQFSKNLSDWVCDVCFPKVTRDKKIKAKPIPKLGDNDMEITVDNLGKEYVLLQNQMKILLSALGETLDNSTYKKIMVIYYDNVNEYIRKNISLEDYKNYPFQRWN
jgi:hypothetical protein